MLDKGFNLLLQIIALKGVMLVVPKDSTILVPSGLLGSLFSLSGHLSAKSSLTCMRTCSGGAFSGVKLVAFLEGGFDLLSSLLSLIRADFLFPSRRWSS